MKPMSLLLLFVLLLAGCAVAAPRSLSIALNGDWECAAGTGTEQAELPAGQAGLTWKTVAVPGWLKPMNDREAGNIVCMWARRTFTVTPGQTNALAILHWGPICFGVTAYINGQRVGEHPTISPYQVLLPAGTLKAGENTIVLKVNGAAGVPRSKTGHMLIPAGFANEATTPNGAQAPLIQGDVWIDFARDACLFQVLAMPDIAKSAVDLRVTPLSPTALTGLTVAATVSAWPDGAKIGNGETRDMPAGTPAQLAANPLDAALSRVVRVPMPGFKPWSYETPNLYTARITLTRGKQYLDEVTIRFGMRDMRVVNGHYQTNGKTLWLRGSELVGDWNWAPGVPGNEVTYLVTEARELSMNAFRTHTCPPPAKWADICDEHGTMLLAEFPVLFNGADYKFTPEEYDIWHKNAITDAIGWMTELWNHPSVIMWVLSNESNYDNAWEMGPFDNFAHAFDPTRPTMRTGQASPKAGTRDNTDWHPCDNLSDMIEGHFYQTLQTWRGKLDARTVTCTEYMNIFQFTPRRGWAGTDDRMANTMEMGQQGMENTEALRRARFDAILPYMYAGWTKTRVGKEWKGGFAGPWSAVWHSALAPVLASLELFDPDYQVGQKVNTNLWLINDSWHDAKIHVDLLLTKAPTEFIPEATCLDTPVTKWSYDFTVPADSAKPTPIIWELPAEEGSYWLVARTTGVSARPVLSQRFIRALKPTEPSAALKERAIVLLGGDAEATAAFRSRGLTLAVDAAALDPAKHIVVIWSTDNLTNAETARAAALLAFADAGGRVLVLGGKAWTMPGLCEVILDGGCNTSRAWAYDGVNTPLLAGISRDMLTRWNGLPGLVGAGALHDKSGSDFKTGVNYCWLYSPSWPVMAQVPTVTGKGGVLFAAFAWSGRLDRAKPTYDPVAERLFLNLLQN